MRTFLDSGVLLTAWRGLPLPETTAAITILEDEQREFLSSENVRLELLPKPTFEKRRAEASFYEDYFNSVKVIEQISHELGEAAMSLAKKYGLAAGDALNLVSAIRLGADEFITSELPGKPMFRVTGVKVKSLHSL